MIQSWNFTNFAPSLYLICIFLVTTKKLSSDLETLHFLTFSAKPRKFKIRERDGHRKVIEKSSKNILSSLWEPWTTDQSYLEK